MMSDPLICYLFRFALLLIAGGVVINGWFMVTRGNWREEVDGTRIKEGALLKGWWFFWHQERSSVKKTWYDGAPLERLVEEIGAYGVFRDNITLTEGVVQMRKYLLVEHNIRELRRAFGVETHVIAEHDVPWAFVKFYKEDTKYVFPEWMRTMMAGCITCFASLYGSIIFWVSYFFFGHVWGFGTSVKGLLLLAATWVAYMLSLAYVNTYLWKKANKS